MLPEIERQGELIKAAESRYRERMNRLAEQRQALRNEEAQLQRDYEVEMHQIQHVNFQEHRDPFVRWAAKHPDFGAYRSAFMEVFKLLPCTLEEIDSFAYRSSWCSTYTELREEAMQAGVLAYRDDDGKDIIIGDRDIPDSEVKPRKPV